MLEDISKEYDYKLGDLIYFRDPEKSLVDSLHFITSNEDMIFMVACHIRYFIAHLYIISFGEGGSDEEDYEEVDEDRGRVDLNDPWWADKISDDEDFFYVDLDKSDGGAGTSKTNCNTSNVEAEN